MTQRSFQHSQPSTYNGPERRAPPPSPLQDDPNHIVSQLEYYIDEKLRANKVEHREYFDKRFDELVLLIRDGFPDGDPRGHREVHEGYIADAKTKKEWRDAVIKQLLTGSVWASFAFIATAVWMAIKQEAKK